MEVSDMELIKDCLGGNQEAFSVLIGRYKKLVFNVAYNMITDKQEVNDIAQEVFIRIYKSLSRYNPEYKFSTWAVKITRNLCIDIIHKKKIDVAPIEEFQDVSSDIETPETKYMDMERSQKIQKAISDLPEKYRTPIVLFHQNGLSYEEMAKILNEPMSIIKNRLYRARLMLRDKLLQYREEGVL